MTIHASINIIFGTNTEHTKKFMEILAPEGYNISMNESGEFSLDDNTARLIILCRTGYELIEKIRSSSDVPIMYVSERADEISVIMALSKGADTVVPESISPMEFAARVKAILRRGSVIRSAKLAADEKLISVGGVCLDPSSRSVTVNGKSIHTTKLEFGILRYLMSRSGSVCSPEEIYTEVWGCKSYDVKKTVVEHIRRLRRKIENDPTSPEYIKAVFGAGYSFCGGITGTFSQGSRTA